MLVKDPSRQPGSGLGSVCAAMLGAASTQGRSMTVSSSMEAAGAAIRHTVANAGAILQSTRRLGAISQKKGIEDRRIRQVLVGPPSTRPASYASRWSRAHLTHRRMRVPPKGNDPVERDSGESRAEAAGTSSRSIRRFPAGPMFNQ